VDSIKPTYAPARGGLRKAQPDAPSEVDSHADEKRSRGPSWDRVERRSGLDRRKQRNRKDPKFDMRNSPGRRKSDGGRPSIETKA
jgi:hypothetical protein